MTAAVPLVERLAEVLHRELGVARCDHGPTLTGSPLMPTCEKWARALLPVVEQAVAEARGEALRQANPCQSGCALMAEALGADPFVTPFDEETP